MQATVYLFDDVAARKRARESRPVDPSGVPPFVCQLERLLRRLGDLHLRISLVRLPLCERWSETVRFGPAIVDNLQDPCALAGQMPDGSVVAAFLGPRGSGNLVGDEEMSERITRRFERALRASKADRMDVISGLTVTHCWTDEIFDVSSLVLELASVRPKVNQMCAGDAAARRKPA